jgi:hypothetical protein
MAHDDMGCREALGEQCTTDETMFAHNETLGRFLSLRIHSSVTYQRQRDDRSLAWLWLRSVVMV